MDSECRIGVIKYKIIVSFYGVLHEVLPYKQLTNKIVLCREILCGAVKIGDCAVSLLCCVVIFGTAVTVMGHRRNWKSQSHENYI